MDDSALVSIIMPAYNSQKFIKNAVMSVMDQTYKNWELIITNDASNDDTINIIKELAGLDSRISFVNLLKNVGAAKARNAGVDRAKGDYIAFLDSDDVWYENKLEIQIKYMKLNDVAFSCTAYSKINENGEPLNKVIKMKKKINKYNDILKTCPGNSTVVYNSKKIGKFNTPDIKKRNDYVLWLQVVKKSDVLYFLNEELSSHRITNGSISSNKVSLVKYHWIVYRKIEKLNVFKSIYLVNYWILKKILW